MVGGAGVSGVRRAQLARSTPGAEQGTNPMWSQLLLPQPIQLGH